MFLDFLTQGGHTELSKGGGLFFHSPESMPQEMGEGEVPVNWSQKCINLLWFCQL